MSRTTSSRWGACVQGVRLSRVGVAVLALCLMVTVATASPGVAATAGGSFKWSSPERIDKASRVRQAGEAWRHLLPVRHPVRRRWLVRIGRDLD